MAGLGPSTRRMQARVRALQAGLYAVQKMCKAAERECEKWPETEKKVQRSLREAQEAIAAAGVIASQYRTNPTVTTARPTASPYRINPTT